MAMEATTNPVLDTLGVSVYHLKHVFLEKLVLNSRKADGTLLSRSSKVCEIEDLNGPPGVIRVEGTNVRCPLDGEMGAAYVHCLSGADHVGEATHMLSYSWGYTIGDIVDTLSDFCIAHELDPKRTCVWICCLCVNQHRVAEQSRMKKSGMLSSAPVDFFTLFGERVRRIGHVLAMLAPWNNPLYLKRVWCVFELYIAHANGCRLDIIMPPAQKLLLEADLLSNKGGIDFLYAALANTKVQNAKASVEEDRRSILSIVESTVGCAALNHRVNELLRAWILQVIKQLMQKRENTSDTGYADFCSSVGLVLAENSEFEEALRLHETALSIRVSLLGETHTDAATSHTNIGDVLQSQGHYGSALRAFNRCLAIREATLGREHPETGRVHDKIGGVLHKKGDYSSALHHFHECLSVLEPALGEHHQHTAATYNSMGLVLHEQGNHTGALYAHQKSLAVRTKVLGHQHPDTATTHDDIGNVLQAMGDLQGALLDYRRCLAIREIALGKEHPDTATSHSNIAAVLEDMGDLDGSLQEFELCLGIRQSVLGKDHPDTATAINSIGHVLCKKGDFSGAVNAFRKGLAIRVSVLGNEHPDTAISHHNIGRVLFCMRNYHSSLLNHTKGLRIRRLSLGDSHPDTAASHDEIGDVLLAMGDEVGARRQHLLCLSILERLLGRIDLRKGAARSNVSTMLLARGDFDGALQETRKSFIIQDAVLGKGSGAGAVHHHHDPALREAAAESGKKTALYRNVELVLKAKCDYYCALREQRKCLHVLESVLEKVSPPPHHSLPSPE